MEEIKKNEQKIEEIKLPCGELCGHNCADGCIYWEPYKRDSNDRQYCNWYKVYNYPSERQGCLSFKG